VIRLGTRGSALALAQAEWVAERLPGEVEIVPIKTAGEVTDKARFVKEIDDALLAGDVDLAVHSAKDVPADLPRGLILFATPERADPRDSVCGAESLDSLPEGAVVGTASLRRRAALLALRPDLDVRDLRGNVDTRLGRLADGDFDAIVLAQAGLDRLGRGEEGNPLDPAGFVPAAGQGCLLIAARDAEDTPHHVYSALNDGAAHDTLHIERTIVRKLDASCHTPIGVHATQDGERSYSVTVFIGLPDGSRWIRDELAGDDADALALNVVERLIRTGAEELLTEAERSVAPG
jgi:hydroxymethylbilane synthase